MESAILNGNNVLIKGVPGSGKTTICNTLFNNFSNSKIILLDIIRTNNLCLNKYKCNCIDINKKDYNKIKLNYDIIIIDDFDLFDKYQTNFITNILLNDNINKTPILVLVNSNNIISLRNWYTLNLNKSYRIPNLICDFIYNRFNIKIETNKINDFEPRLNATDIDKEIEYYMSLGYNKNDILIITSNKHEIIESKVIIIVDICNEKSLYKSIIKTSERLSIINSKINDNYGIRKFIELCSEESLDKCINLLTIKKRINNDYINIQNKVNEINVSNINGLAIVSFYEYKTTGKMKIFNSSLNNYLLNKDEIDIYLNNEFKYILTLNDIFYNCNTNQELIKRILFISHFYITTSNKQYSKLNELNKFDWLTENNIEICIDRINKLIGNNKNKQFEKEISLSGEINLTGYIDYIDDSNIIEFKLKNNVSKQDFIQLVLYKHIINNNHTCYLYNIKDDNLYNIECLNTNDIIKILISDIKNEITNN